MRKIFIFTDDRGNIIEKVEDSNGRTKTIQVNDKIFNYEDSKEEDKKIEFGEAYTTINMKDNVFKRKAGVIKDIAKLSVSSQVRDVKAHTSAATVGLVQGLKYNGDLKRGIKAALVTEVVYLGTRLTNNIVTNWEVIKDA